MGSEDSRHPMCRVNRIKRIIYALLAIAGFAQPALGQGRYAVEDVHPRALDRPPASVLRDSLPPGAAGKEPRFDGDSFVFHLSNALTGGASEAQVRFIVDRVLIAIGWRRDPAELVFAGTHTVSPADSLTTEAIVTSSIGTTQDDIDDSVGNLGTATRNAIAASAEHLRRMLRRRQILFQYHQQYVNASIGPTPIPIEKAVISAVWQDERGLIGVSGRVFANVNVENRVVYTREQGIDRARNSLRLSGYPVPPEPNVCDLVLLPFGSGLRYSWRVEAMGIDGPYLVWVDAESGKILKLSARFWSAATTKGRVFSLNPWEETKELTFEIDEQMPAKLVLSDGNVPILDVQNGNAFSPMDDIEHSSLDFNQPPFLLAEDETATSIAGNYNGYVQHINAYAWLYYFMRHFSEVAGEPLDDEHLSRVTVIVNDDDVDGKGPNQAWATPEFDPIGMFGGTIELGIGSATLGETLAGRNTYNTALDATVIIHEFGHFITEHYAQPLTKAMDEGLSDYWSCTAHNTQVFGMGWGFDLGTPQQDASVPRQVDELDVFPDHRRMDVYGNGTNRNTGFHADGQILAWALWKARSGLNELLNGFSLGLERRVFACLPSLNSIEGIEDDPDEAEPIHDKVIHDSFVNLLDELIVQYSGERELHKVLAGFAHAGLFSRERDAIIEIDADYLDGDSEVGPTFTVWNGRDYFFSGFDAEETSPSNTHFRIELSSNDTFTDNLRSSGVLMGFSETLANSGVFSATWQIPPDMWNGLKGANKLYYRVATFEASGANETWSRLPNPWAEINHTNCGCGCCGANASSASSAPSFMMLVLVCFVVWLRSSLRRG